MADMTDPSTPNTPSTPSTIDLSGQPYWADHDHGIMPTVREDLVGVRMAVIGWIGRLRAGAEMYAPVESGTQGGLLRIGQAQVRHLHAELGRLIEKWDTRPRDLAAEADIILRDTPGRRFLSRTLGSCGYEIETDGTTVHVYHHDGRERIGEDSSGLPILHPYALALEAAGYRDVTVQNSTEEYAARVAATPPAAAAF